MKKQLILTGKALLFIVVMPFLVLAVAVGFRSCWQCGETSHYNYMRHYWTLTDTKKPVDVCLSCHEMLLENDRKGWS